MYSQRTCSARRILAQRPKLQELTKTTDPTSNESNVPSLLDIITHQSTLVFLSTLLSWKETDVLCSISIILAMNPSNVSNKSRLHMNLPFRGQLGDHFGLLFAQHSHLWPNLYSIYAKRPLLRSLSVSSLPQVHATESQSPTRAFRAPPGKITQTPTLELYKIQGWAISSF